MRYCSFSSVCHQSIQLTVVVDSDRSSDPSPVPSVPEAQIQNNALSQFGRGTSSVCWYMKRVKLGIEFLQHSRSEVS